VRTQFPHQDTIFVPVSQNRKVLLLRGCSLVARASK